MEFGQSAKCTICKKEVEVEGDYHRYTCDLAGIDMVFYACKGDCDLKFRGEYVDPFKDDPIKDRFEILDL